MTGPPQFDLFGDPIPDETEPEPDTRSYGRRLTERLRDLADQGINPPGRHYRPRWQDVRRLHPPEGARPPRPHIPEVRPWPGHARPEDRRAPLLARLPPLPTHHLNQTPRGPRPTPGRGPRHVPGDRHP